MVKDNYKGFLRSFEFQTRITKTKIYKGQNLAKWLNISSYTMTLYANAVDVLFYNNLQERKVLKLQESSFLFLKHCKYNTKH